MKKQKMIANKRDRDLLMLLITLVVAFLIYNYVMAPAIEKGRELKSELSAAEQQLDLIDTTIRDYPKLVEKEAELSSEIAAKYSNFFYEIVQERILYNLDTLILNAGLPVSRYSCSPVEAMPVELPRPEYYPLDYPLRDLAAELNPEFAKEASIVHDESTGGSIPTTDITIDFSATSYEATMAFIKSVEEMDKSILMKNVALRKGDDYRIDGQLIMSFYAMPQIDDSMKNYLEFSPVIPKGKENPFD